DRGDADPGPRGGAADELDAPGRAAGRRRRDDRVAGQSGVVGRERERCPGVRPVAAGGVTAMLTTLRAALPGRGDAMPSEARTRSVAIDGDPLARYAHVCGFPLSDRVPPTFPHVLAHPLFLELLAASPFSAVGVVHIANRIVQHRPLTRGEELEMRVRAGEFMPHRRGRTFDFVSAAYAARHLPSE